MIAAAQMLRGQTAATAAAAAAERRFGVHDVVVTRQCHLWVVQHGLLHLFNIAYGSSLRFTWLVNKISASKL